MRSTNRLIVSMLVVAALAVAFWVLLLGPKRQEAGELSEHVSQLQTTLAESQAKEAEAVVAKHAFPTDYQQLVVLGKAVPASDSTSSLLVELNHIAHHSKVKFNSIQLGEGSGEEVTAAAPTTTVPTAPAGTSASAPVTPPPTEVAASLLPLGATIGPAGLGVMPYELTFSGNFFHVADFIRGIDSLVHTGKSVAVDGRLVTFNGFALNADSTLGFPHLDATFSVTTYLTPPSQGVTAGATATTPSATPTATTSSTEAPTTTATTASSAR